RGQLRHPGWRIMTTSCSFESNRLIIPPPRLTRAGRRDPPRSLAETSPCIRKEAPSANRANRRTISVPRAKGRRRHRRLPVERLQIRARVTYGNPEDFPDCAAGMLVNVEVVDRLTRASSLVNCVRMSDRSAGLPHYVVGQFDLERS